MDIEDRQGETLIIVSTLTKDLCFGKPNNDLGNTEQCVTSLDCARFGPKEPCHENPEQLTPENYSKPCTPTCLSNTTSAQRCTCGCRAVEIDDETLRGCGTTYALIHKRSRDDKRRYALCLEDQAVHVVEEGASVTSNEEAVDGDEDREDDDVKAVGEKIVLKKKVSFADDIEQMSDSGSEAACERPSYGVFYTLALVSVLILTLSISVAAYTIYEFRHLCPKGSSYSVPIDLSVWRKE